MPSTKNEALLSNAKVQEEISKHRWIESEKAGSDIGFDRAAKDWLNRFSDDWIKANLSQHSGVTRSAPKVANNKTRAKRG